MSRSQSFLQSPNWLEFQKSLGRKVFIYDQDGIKAGVIKLPLLFSKNYLYLPHGPEMDFNAMRGGEKNPVWNFLHWLKDLARKEKAIFSKAEPLNDHVAQTLAERKFKKSQKEIQPAKTVQMDLTLSPDDWLDKMHHKTRYNIGMAEKRRVVIQESDDSDVFWKLLQKTAKRDGFFLHPKDYYRKLLSFFQKDDQIKVKLFLAYRQSEPLAGALVLLYQDGGFYLHGASDYDQRRQMAPHLLHWKIMRELKGRGFKKYDWWGINARQWPGVTRFKLSWGGRVIEYPGSFDWPFSWWWYQSYKLARKIF